VIEPGALDEAFSSDEGRSTPRFRGLPPAAVVVVGLVVLLIAFLLWQTAHRAPGDDSLEAGFARDMIVHHDQAVVMALLIRDRTTDPRVKTLATDILLTQENQIGQMLGWLNVWGLSATGVEPAMAWMGHPTTGLMPGMATPEELKSLEGLSGDSADQLFLQLMIHHHQGAIPMAQEALARSGNTPVRDLAQAILAAQQAEIVTMEELLRTTSASGVSP
jgi:uncharacterized protein (DUF305 family)